ncbi:glycosyltransferase family protein [Telluribacter humicola]|uniref:hypothetical protein n=1 Tax=Telluribacter humicola TaxID=1720261 RepID=UPI001A96053B|nr:hypothetical protein [Telluribacter humicola]
MKIGFVVSFFDFRNDVRRVITEVARQHQVVVFGKPQQAEAILRHLPEGVEFRFIEEQKPTVWNSLWERLYLLLKAIPRSRNNYFLMELFKASITTNPTQRKKAYQILSWSRRLPKVVSYDTYLDHLQIKQQTKIDDIDKFVFFTAIGDDYLLARLIREQHPNLRVYVYSWDHPCKHTCFSRRVNYFIWTEPLRQDVIELQNIPASKVQVIGASQFGYIEEFNREYRHRLPRSYPFRYIYIGCAIGPADLVPDEVNVIEQVAHFMAQTHPDLKLVVRPYPLVANWSLYSPIRSLPNVVIDDGFQSLDLSVTEAHLMEKFEKIHNAEAFFHLGTTMGLEACFTDTPSFILDFGYTSRQGLSLYNFIHQYQNDRHLIDLAPQNAITSLDELRKVLDNLDNPTYQVLNQRVQQQYTLKSFAAFADDLTEGSKEKMTNPI